MNQQDKRWALVTGASSGLGADFARQLAAQGYSLLLVARSLAPMQALADTLIAQHGVAVEVLPQDLAAPGAAQALKERIDALGLPVELLVNNAGFGVHGAFHQQPLDRLQGMLQLNIVALTELTRLFAADMAARGHGQILLVASVGAYQATPTYAAYCASKAYVLLLGEALHEELKPHGVQVTVLSPGVTATHFFDVSGQQPTPYQRMVIMQSKTVVRRALSALAARRAAVVPGLLNALTVFGNRFVPRAWQRRLAYRLMRND